MDGRETERDMAGDAGLDRTGKHLAVGEIVMPVAVDPGPPANVVGQVGVLGHDPDFPAAVEVISQRLLLARDPFPGADRVGGVQVTGAEHEILVLGQ